MSYILLERVCPKESDRNCVANIFLNEIACKWKAINGPKIIFQLNRVHNLDEASKRNVTKHS